MKHRVSIIGGDLRIVKLAKMLAGENNEVCIYALEKAEELKEIENIRFCENMKDAIEKPDIVVGPIPFSSNGKEINTPFSDKTITIRELLNEAHGKVLVAGSVPISVCDILDEENIEMVDVMQKEELAVLNTIATAEGAIEVAISNTNKILHGSEILILGFGRVAKTLAIKLKGLSANVTCAARKSEDEAWIRTYGYKYLNINTLGENLNKFDIIMNTVPNLILTDKKLRYVNKECLLIDLSSKPGGIDENKAKEYGINMKWALALPGKVAPVTTAEFIKEIINKILEKIYN